MLASVPADGESQATRASVMMISYRRGLVRMKPTSDYFQMDPL
jgi:hypothetical protein